jgi:hypothetical protein
MPNVDGGHYFLTALVPVLGDPVARDDGSVTAASHALREALASLPTAVQSAACVATGQTSPFARCRRTHFARLVVIDQPFYNGRDPADAIVQSVRKTNLLTPQAHDCFSTPWLLLVIDFDVNQDGDHGLDGYLRGLWAVMAPELKAVFGYCHGFADVTSAEAFSAYIRSCQIGTTMPFNDYWSTAFNPPSLSLAALIGIAGALFLLLGAAAWFCLHALHVSAWWLGLALPVGVGGGGVRGGGLGLGLALVITYRFVMARGAKPFPTAPGSDLRTILKALYLQPRFTGFAAAHQADDPAALHAAFGTFLAETVPGDVNAPTRVPGAVAL